MEITISDTGISEKRRRVLATEGFASDIYVNYIYKYLYYSISMEFRDFIN